MAQRQSAPEPSRHNKIGPLPFLMIRHLFSKDRGEANLCHASPLQHTLALHQSRSRNDQHVIAPTLAAGLEQKRYVEHGEPLPTATDASEKPPFFNRDHRVQNCFEPGECNRVAKYFLPEKRPIDAVTLALHTSKGIGNCANSPASRREQSVNHLIGIEQRHPEAAQHRRSCALAHADGSGEADYNQCGGAKLATTAARSSAVT